MARSAGAAFTLPSVPASGCHPPASARSSTRAAISPSTCTRNSSATGPCGSFVSTTARRTVPSFHITVKLNCCSTCSSCFPSLTACPQLRVHHTTHQPLPAGFARHPSRPPRDPACHLLSETRHQGHLRGGLGHPHHLRAHPRPFLLSAPHAHPPDAVQYRCVPEELPSLAIAMAAISVLRYPHPTACHPEGLRPQPQRQRGVWPSLYNLACHA